MLAADQKIDDRDGQHDQKQHHRSRRRIGGVAAGIAVEHVVDIANQRVHFGRVQVGAENGNRIGVGLESTDKAGDHQVKYRGRDHGQRDPGKHPPFGGAVHGGGIVEILPHRCQSTGQHQNFKGHDHPDRIKAQHEHLRPVGAVYKVHRTYPEPGEQQVYEAVGIGRLLEQQHKYQTHRQGVCHIGQEEDGLIKLSQRLDVAQPQADQQRKTGRQRHGDHHQNKGVFQSLEKVGVMEDVGEIIKAYAVGGLGGGIVSLFQRINEHIDQRIDQKQSQKDQRRQQVQPAL